MIKNNLFPFLCLFLSCTFSISAQDLTERSQVSLLTISADEELWSFAGHSVFRISDPEKGIDANFNYGVFDFRTEDFYLKFLLGTLPYQLGAYNFRDETPNWINNGRKITEQVLDLSLNQRQKVFDLLIENYQPENRLYQYKFFYDNCSTRIRDVLAESCGDSLRFSKSLNPDSTFRDWIGIYNRKSNNFWAEFGMNILLGPLADEATNASRAMFIPDNLMIAFDSASIQRNGEWQSLVAHKKDLNELNITFVKLPITPFYFFTILFLIIAYISFMEYHKKKWYLPIDKIIFSITGILGWFVFVLWFFSDHEVMANNLNIFWAFPFTFPAIWLLNRTLGNQKWLKIIFFIQMILALFLLICFKFLPQTFPNAIIPITGIVLLRSFLIWQRKGNQELLNF